MATVLRVESNVRLVKLPIKADKKKGKKGGIARRVFLDITVFTPTRIGESSVTYTASVWVPPLPYKPELRVKDPTGTARYPGKPVSRDTNEFRRYIQGIYPTHTDSIMALIESTMAPALETAMAGWERRKAEAEAEKAALWTSCGVKAA